jgi:EAL domain-containing protein (putative c-di-GMP-specific phosphodiesterase class I)
LLTAAQAFAGRIAPPANTGLASLACITGLHHWAETHSVTRSIGLAHIVRQPDGTATGVWGPFALKSAFQPIFAFRGERLEIAAFEGLIRPFRDGQGMSPGTFFRAVPPADRLHVETLTRTLHLLNAGACLDPAAALFVNFDPSLVSDAELIGHALRDMRLVLHEAGIDPARIVCEVTEQRTSSESGLHLFVRSLRAEGFRIAVDDYGAEESGIKRINELRPDIVKFDAHWITRLMASGPGFALLEAMVAEFRGRGIINLFEGIEEPWQLDLAQKCGVDMVQGFVLARPEIAPTSFRIFSKAAADPRAAAEPAGFAPSPVVAAPTTGLPDRARTGASVRRNFGRRSA